MQLINFLCSILIYFSESLTYLYKNSIRICYVYVTLDKLSADNYMDKEYYLHYTTLDHINKAIISPQNINLLKLQAQILPAGSPPFL